MEQPRQTLSVLLVDDSPEDRFTVRRLLSRNPEVAFFLREAETGEQGLALYRESVPDCILLDYHLGDMNGVQFLQELNDSPAPDEPICPVVMMTSSGTEGVAVQALKGGAQDYLLKDTITMRSLRFAIESAIETVQLHRRLRESEARLRASLDNMLDCFGIYSPVRDGAGRIIDFRIDYLNGASCLASGLTRTEQVGQNLAEVIPAYRTVGLIDAFARIMETGAPIERSSLVFYEECPDKPEPQERVFDLRAWKMGEGIASSWRDITDRVEAEQERSHAEEALRESEEFLRRMIESNPDCIKTLDREGKLLSINDRGTAMLEFPNPEAAIGMDWLSIWKGDAHRVATEALRGARRGVTTAFTAFGATMKGTPRWWDVTLAPIQSADGRVERILCVSRDVTDREEARASLTARYQRERGIAASLQQSLLSQPPADAFPGLAFHTRYFPAFSEAEIGGDFYDLFDLPDGRVALVVGDISGKGLEAARHVAEIKYSFRAYLRESGNVVRALERVNIDLCRSFGVHSAASEESIPPLSFVCLSLVVLDTAAGTAEVVAAGAERPLLLRNTGAAVVEMTEEVYTPLGIAEEVKFGVTSCPVAPGDLIVQVTDGITEARRGNQFLGSEGLTDILQAALPLVDLDRIADAIVSGARDFGQGVLRDDVCLLLARRI